jgi:hypothetical protein
VAEEPSAAPPSLAADTIASQLGGAEIPEGYVCFKGYLDEGGDGTHRIVVDEQFLRWLVVTTSDIAGKLDTPADAQDPRDLIWVRRGARMTKCEVGYAPDIANEGWGVDPVEGFVTDAPQDVGELNATAMSGRFRPQAFSSHPPPPY